VYQVKTWWVGFDGMGVLKGSMGGVWAGVFMNDGHIGARNMLRQ
jgi:hypothetical protein